ncbi:6-phospho-3-hexuloisomerase [Methanocella arvoryzae]|uniref:Hexulose-6-phosphate isomerase n=1 Tax=Methanocella arvoryzae (strain DSM 22066 / NBRC 105507 / MRE50) TaxID=351160 RepID=Q0W0H5_METAR|nr:6-phospho-3-hexuloisomerase [Methanocella arvoryzae]CAJ38118.1 putative hexulose-6-phosphate isomerase [Methanocella arvoryzae MRE50]
MEVKSPRTDAPINVNTNQVVTDTMISIADSLINIADSIDASNLDEFASMLTSANRIFVMGAGRSGLVAKSFAMRLMHIGFQVYVVGEIITPAVTAGDVVVAISGSGNTRTISEFGEICKKLNVKLVTVTTNKDSALGRMSDLVVILDNKQKPVQSKEYMERQLRGNHKSLTPLGTLFELTAAVFLDAFIAKMMVIKGVDESFLKQRHTVLE